MTQRIGNFSRPCVKCDSKASNGKTWTIDTPFLLTRYLWDDVTFIFSKLCNINCKLNSGGKKSAITDYHSQDHRHLNQKSPELEKV